MKKLSTKDFKIEAVDELKKRFLSGEHLSIIQIAKEYFGVSEKSDALSFLIAKQNAKQFVYKVRDIVWEEEKEWLCVLDEELVTYSRYNKQKRKSEPWDRIVRKFGFVRTKEEAEYALRLASHFASGVVANLKNLHKDIKRKQLLPASRILVTKVMLPSLKEKK